MRAACRRWRRIAALAAALLACLPPHLFMKLMGLPSRWPRRFLGLAARAVGARVRVTGEPRSADVFFIANHVSWIDILALGGATGAAFVAHDGIERWPVVGWLAAQNNTIFVARSRRQDIGGQLDRLRAALRGHQPVALFPEGTTSDGSGLLPFKPSLLAGLMPPPRAVMIQPVHIDYGAATRQIAWCGEEPAGANATRLLARPGPLMVTLHFLDPFDPAALADRKALAVQAHQKIAASIQRQLAASAAHSAPV